MDLKQLATVSTRTRLQDNKRHLSATEHSLQGYILLHAAQETGFRDRELLKSACDEFMGAIRLNRTAPDAYFGMAYLLYLIGDYVGAKKYLQEAQRIAPDHPDIKTIFEQMEQAPPADITTSFTKPTGTDNHDKLYEQLEQMIINQVHQLSIVPLLSAPIIDEPAMLEMQELQKQLLETYTYIQTQLEHLNAEMDTTHLRNKLRPLEIELKRMDNRLRVAEKMSHIQMRIQAELTRVREVSKQLQISHMQDMGTLIEDILDRCDAIADELDLLSDKGQVIQHLNTEYEMLVTAVEDLQDIADEI